jgi:alpha-mannosidase
MSETDKKKIHMICNAHLDPEWLWEWEEGAAAMLGTFRQAAEFCDEYEGEKFVFNHNEAILYRWVEEYEPELFVKIQRLVKEGKWHIMGGWYLQPDCNMTSGESFVRQIMLGRQYFKKKFGKVPTTAINFDPFGHTRGLVQILAKCGYDSYVFCRPLQHELKLDSMDFVWEGYDGSQVIAHRSHDMYFSLFGKARAKVEEVIEHYWDHQDMMVLWGVGNHGENCAKRSATTTRWCIPHRSDISLSWPKSAGPCRCAGKTSTRPWWVVTLRRSGSSNGTVSWRTPCL